MSVVPNNKLKSADSLDLITFSIEDRNNLAIYNIDTWTQYKSFWKGIVLRNLHSTLGLFYKTNPDAALRELRASSERPIKGWGSYFHVEQSGTPDYEIDFEVVALTNALVT